MAYQNKDVLKRNIYTEGQVVTWYASTGTTTDNDEDTETPTLDAGSNLTVTLRYVKTSDKKLIEAGYKPEQDIIVNIPWDKAVVHGNIIEWNSAQYYVKEINKSYGASTSDVRAFQAICVYQADV